ncbi:MAG: hypothetical protein AAF216_05840 [Pseudomonadota bacterium]
MDDDDLDLNEKNVVGSIDRSIVNFGLVIVALVPTYFHLIFSPRKMVPLLRGEAIDGRQGLRLGPGITFIFTILVLLGVGFLFRNIGSPELVGVEPGEDSSGMRSAVAEGNLWRSIVLSLPFYFMALFFGVVVHVSHLVAQKHTDIAQAIGIGLYVFSTLVLLIVPFGISLETIASETVRTGVLLVVFLVGFFAVLPWQLFSFSRHAFQNSAPAAAAVTALCLVLIFIALIGFGVLVAVLM